MEVMSRAMVEKKDIFMQGRMIAGGLNISIIVHHHVLDGARQAGSGEAKCRWRERIVPPTDIKILQNIIALNIHVLLQINHLYITGLLTSIHIAQTDMHAPHTTHTKIIVILSCTLMLPLHLY